METYTIQTTLTLDNEMFEDVIDCAGYGIGYWAHTATIDGVLYKITWDGEDFEDSSPYATGKKTLTYSMIGEAIEKLHTHSIEIRGDLHTQLNEWLMGEESMDSDLADVIIQIALFDDVIYG